MIMLWWSHLSKKVVFSLTIGSITTGIAGVSALLLVAKDYQTERLRAYLNPDEYANGAGYIYGQLKERMTGANWFGEAAQARSIPYLHTDFALSGLTSQFGYAAAIVVLLILVLFVIRMSVIASEVRSGYGQLLVVGAVALFSLQFFYNIAMTFGLVPIISMSLPFISYGGMPTLFNAFLIGIVLSVYRRKQFAAMEDGGCRAK